MDLLEAKRLALSLMHQYNLKDWRFDFNNRKGSYGMCYFTKKTIYLSSPLTAAMQEKDVKNTVLHEIAHALVGQGHGHDYVWLRKAREIGCDGESCNNHNIIVENVRFKYVATCPRCGEKIGVSRAPKRTQWHNKCFEGFKPENILKYIQQY
jgi:predicted SprT family Zn-dependent metalloprotease